MLHLLYRLGVPNDPGNLLGAADHAIIFEQAIERYARNATVFRHFLASFPDMLAHALRSLMKKGKGERKKSA
jgi:hypothetical protein